MIAWKDLLCVLCAVAACAVFGPGPAGLAGAAGPTTKPIKQAAGGGLDARAAALARRVLADPLNAALREELRALREEQEKAAMAAYESLAQGLWAYLELGPELAAPAIEKAAASPRAASLAAFLGRPLGKLLPELREAVKAAATGKSGPCVRCGGTGEDDCRAYRCYGSGRVPCEACKGMGTLRRELPGLGRFVMVICPDCGGTGVVACEACRGSGVVACPACQKRPDEPATPRVPVPQQQEIRRVIDCARWLRGGGIDLYTAGALEPTPK